MSADALAIDLPGGGRVLFTERAHGNASSVAGEGAEDGALVRERLRELAGVRALARGYQVHGSVVERVRVPPAPEPASVGALAAHAHDGGALDARAEPRRAAGAAGGACARRSHPTPVPLLNGRGITRPGIDKQADGQATALRLVGATVLTADCLPVALGGQGAVAMVHAGWRGLAAGVLEEGVRAARELGAFTPTHAVIGPGAGVCCYEVGPEVHEALGGGARSHGGHIDLHAIARERLLAAGVREVIDLGICTICDERFFSHRREGERAGRQAAIAWLDRSAASRG